MNNKNRYTLEFALAGIRTESLLLSFFLKMKTSLSEMNH